MGMSTEGHLRYGSQHDRDHDDFITYICQETGQKLFESRCVQRGREDGSQILKRNNLRADPPQQRSPC